MLRKLTHIIVMMLLLISTTGITLSMHYCGGRLVSTSIITEAKSCCGEDCGCCENKTHHYEVKENFVSSNIIQKINIAQLNILIPVYFVLDYNFLNTEERSFHEPENTSPPPIIQTRLALLQTYLC